jgi:hypothetical protein
MATQMSLMKMNPVMKEHDERSQCLLPGTLQVEALLFGAFFIAQVLPEAAQYHLDPIDSQAFHPHSREITTIFSYTQPG